MPWIQRFVAVLAVLALSAAGYLYVTDRPSQTPPPFLVGDTRFDFEPMPPGEHQFSVTLTNPADVPRRILGLAGG